MKKIIVFVVVLLASCASYAHACEFCTLHNGLGQYNNQGDFISLTYRQTDATTTVSGGSVQPQSAAIPPGYGIHIQTVQLYYQHSFSDEVKGILTVPYYDKFTTLYGAKADTSAGIGDVIAMLRYRLWGNNDRFLSLLIGAKLPTGGEKDSVGTTSFNPDLVTGTGSTDPLLGFVYSHNIMNWNFSVDALYKRSGRGYEDYQFGNVLNLGAGSYYRVSNYFNVGLGFASEIMDPDKDYEGTATGTPGIVPNTGGSVVYFQPTLQYTNQNFYVDVTYQTPVYRNFIGTQTVVDHKYIVSARYAF